MGLQMFVISSSMIALISLVNRFGSQETAAFNAAMQLWNYVQMPALAIGAAASSMAAQNVGAGRWDRVGKVATTGVLFNFLIGGSLITTVFVFNQHALSLFLPAHGAALNLSVASQPHRHLVISLLRYVDRALRSGACDRRRDARRSSC